MTTDDMRQQVARAYRLMAQTGYRPGAPSDGLGNIVGPLNLAREIETYREQWLEEEDSRHYLIGVGDFSTRVPLVLTVEAARLLCAPDGPHAAELLRLAILRIEEEPS